MLVYVIDSLALVQCPSMQASTKPEKSNGRRARKRMLEERYIPCPVGKLQCHIPFSYKLNTGQFIRPELHVWIWLDITFQIDYTLRPPIGPRLLGAADVNINTTSYYNMPPVVLLLHSHTFDH